MRVCLEVSKIYFISPNFAFFLASLFEPSFLVANIIIIIKIFNLSGFWLNGNMALGCYILTKLKTVKNKATEPAIIITLYINIIKFSVFLG